MTTLSKAIESIAAKAKKQVGETGSLQGFSANYRDLSGSRVTALSISTIAADEDNVIFEYELDTDHATGKSMVKGEQESPARLIEELMTFLNRLSGACKQKTTAPLRAHA